MQNLLFLKYFKKKRKVYDYRNVILPSDINKKNYSLQNQHLPKIFFMSEYSKLFFITVENQDIGAIKALISRGANINVRDIKNGYTPLMYAVKNDKKSSVKYLIIKGANLNITSYDGKTALHIAAITKNFDILKMLISNKANIFIHDTQGKTFYDYISPDDKKLINYLFSGIDNINEVLIDTCILDSLEGVKYALSKGADINFQSYNGDTPLIIATRYSYADMVIFLLENGADETIQNLYEENALNIALMKNDKLIVSIIETVMFSDELYRLGLTKKLRPEKSKIPITKKEINKKHEENSFYNFDIYPSQRFLNSKDKLFLYTER